MKKNTTITVQQVRKDPVAFLKRINSGKTLTVIYNSKPLATVTSADNQPEPQLKNIQRLLEYAELARQSAKTSLDSTKSYKELYSEYMSQKYDIPGR
jgi:antitoxin (DNA-binding transcriptional repressor) of toxin-antitoxin stability system